MEQSEVFVAKSEALSRHIEPVETDAIPFERGAAPDDAPLVLVVEDNPDVRAYICENLSAHYRVEWSPDGTNGFAKARSLTPDLVIADVMMPGMDGYELCHALRTHDKLSHVPIILLTARASGADRIEGLKKGADDYICKPFRMAELLVRVENLIELRRAIRERFSDEVVIRPGDISVPSEDAAFLEKVHEAIENQLGNTNFTVEVLASSVGLSTRQLYRRLKKTTHLSPGGFILKMRLQRAAQLLERRAGSVSQIAHEVGFNDADYFSRLFRQTYGVPPSEYMENMT